MWLLARGQRPGGPPRRAPKSVGRAGTREMQMRVPQKVETPKWVPGTCPPSQRPGLFHRFKFGCLTDSQVVSELYPSSVRPCPSARQCVGKQDPNPNPNRNRLGCAEERGGEWDARVGVCVLRGRPSGITIHTTDTTTTTTPLPPPRIPLGPCAPRCPPGLRRTGGRRPQASTARRRTPPPPPS